MPRIYMTKGELKRKEPITALFTTAEKERVRQMALASNLPPSVFVYRLVIARLEGVR
jgi:hypothetical protein